MERIFMLQTCSVGTFAWQKIHNLFVRSVGTFRATIWNVSCSFFRTFRTLL